MEHKQNKNESFSEYCHRISSIARQEENLTWDQVTQIINTECEVNYSDWYYRNKEKHYKSDSYDILAEKMLQMSKNKMKLAEERNQITALVRRLSREETIKEIAKDAVEKISSKKILNHNTVNCLKYDDYEGLLLISDWHYGLDIQNNFNSYSTSIARERIETLFQKTVDKCDKLNIKTLHVANLGDMIAGNIHLPLRLNSRIDVITQIMEVSELIAEFINDLSSRYEIHYYSVIDNHSRIEPKKSDSLDLESLCRITDWYVRLRLPYIYTDELSFGNDICTTEIKGHPIAFVHGHKDKQGMVIEKINSFTENHFDLICCAHYHHFSANEKCETFMVSNGSLMGTDDYAYGLRLRSKPSQTLIAITEENVVDSIYKFDL